MTLVVKFEFGFYFVTEMTSYGSAFRFGVKRTKGMQITVHHLRPVNLAKNRGKKSYLVPYNQPENRSTKSFEKIVTKAATKKETRTVSAQSSKEHGCHIKYQCYRVKLAKGLGKAGKLLKA